MNLFGDLFAGAGEFFGGGAEEESPPRLRRDIQQRRLILEQQQRARAAAASSSHGQRAPPSSGIPAGTSPIVSPREDAARRGAHHGGASRVASGARSAHDVYNPAGISPRDGGSRAAVSGAQADASTRRTWGTASLGRTVSSSSSSSGSSASVAPARSSVSISGGGGALGNGAQRGSFARGTAEIWPGNQGFSSSACVLEAPRQTTGMSASITREEAELGSRSSTRVTASSAHGRSKTVTIHASYDRRSLESSSSNRAESYAILGTSSSSSSSSSSVQPAGGASVAEPVSPRPRLDTLRKHMSPERLHRERETRRAFFLRGAGPADRGAGTQAGAVVSRGVAEVPAQEAVSSPSRAGGAELARASAASAARAAHSIAAVSAVPSQRDVEPDVVPVRATPAYLKQASAKAPSSDAGALVMLLHWAKFLALVLWMNLLTEGARQTLRDRSARAQECWRRGVSTTRENAKRVMPWVRFLLVGPPVLSAQIVLHFYGTDILAAARDARSVAPGPAREESAESAESEDAVVEQEGNRGDEAAESLAADEVSDLVAPSLHRRAPAGSTREPVVLDAGLRDGASSERRTDTPDDSTTADEDAGLQSGTPASVADAEADVEARPEPHAAQETDVRIDPAVKTDKGSAEQGEVRIESASRAAVPDHDATLLERSFRFAKRVATATNRRVRRAVTALKKFVVAERTVTIALVSAERAARWFLLAFILFFVFSLLRAFLAIPAYFMGLLHARFMRVYNYAYHDVYGSYCTDYYRRHVQTGWESALDKRTRSAEAENQKLWFINLAGFVIGTVMGGGMLIRLRALRRTLLDRSKKVDVLKDMAAEDADKLCCVCLDAQKCVLTMPCNHVCLCLGCFDMLERPNCPLCNSRVYQYLERVYV
eukprot:gene99-183_t